MLCVDMSFLKTPVNKHVIEICNAVLQRLIIGFPAVSSVRWTVENIRMKLQEEV